MATRKVAAKAGNQHTKTETTVQAEKKAAQRSRSCTRRSKLHKQHQLAVKAATAAAQTEGKTAANNRRSNTNIWSKAAKAGFSSATPKQRQQQQQQNKDSSNNRKQQQQKQHQTTANRKSGSKSNTNSKNQQHTTRKARIKQQQKLQNSIKSSKSSTNILEGQKRQGCVFHNDNSSKEARMRGPNPEKKRPRGVGPRRVVAGEEEEEERLPVEIRWDIGKFCLNWLR